MSNDLDTMALPNAPATASPAACPIQCQSPGRVTVTAGGIARTLDAAPNEWDVVKVLVDAYPARLSKAEFFERSSPYNRPDIYLGRFLKRNPELRATITTKMYGGKPGYGIEPGV